MAKARPIFVPGTNKVYPSVAAAAKDLGINASGISKVLSGKRPHAGGYRFGYESDRVIYVPETGQTFSTFVQASRKLGVKNKKLESVLQSGVDRTVGGYHFTYESSAALSRQSQQAQASIASTPEPRATGRNATKQVRIEQKRQKKAQKLQQQQQREYQRRQEREKEKKRREEKEARKAALRPYKKEMQRARKELHKLVQQVNEKLKEYAAIHPYYSYFNSSMPDVMALTNLIGENADVFKNDEKNTTYFVIYFNEKFKEFLVEDDEAKSVQEIQEAMKAAQEKLELLKQRLKDETDAHKGRFWDMDVARKTLAQFTFEFGDSKISEKEFLEYGYLIWDFLDVIHQAAEDESIGSDVVYNAIKDAVQHKVNTRVMEQFIDEIQSYFDGTGIKYVDEILDELKGYYNDNPDDWDDNNEGWTI